MSKRVHPLSAIRIAKLKPDVTRTIELVDGAVPGLRMRMSPAGAVRWSLNIRDRKGERRRFDVGQGLGLAAARKRAEELRRLVHDGADPTAEKRLLQARARAAKAGIGTFRSVIEAYFATGPGKLLETAKEQKRRVYSVFAAHLDRPALEVTPPELQLSADRHASAASAAHAVAYLKPAAKWAAKRELMKQGFAELEKPIPALTVGDESGQRVLTEKELRAILPLLTTAPYDAAARFMLWTGTRLSEVCGATWSEVDLSAGTWTIPAMRRKDTRSKTRTKQVAGQNHVIRLPRQALHALEESCAGPGDSLVFSGRFGARLRNWDRWSKSKMASTGIKGWDRHTLRRTTATLAGNLGAPPHVISALLGHRNIGNQLIAGYSKARYSREVGEALQLVADRLQAIERGSDRIVILTHSV
jgi:integrase